MKTAVTMQGHTFIVHTSEDMEVIEKVLENQVWLLAFVLFQLLVVSRTIWSIIAFSRTFPGLFQDWKTTLNIPVCPGCDISLQLLVQYLHHTLRPVWLSSEGPPPLRCLTAAATGHPANSKFSPNVLVTFQIYFNIQVSWNLPTICSLNVLCRFPV